MEEKNQRVKLSVNKRRGVLQRASAMSFFSVLLMGAALTFTNFQNALLIVLESAPLIVVGVLIFFEAFAGP